MKNSFYTRAFLVLVLTGISTCAMASQIELFSVTQHPFTNQGNLTACYLNDMSLRIRQLNLEVQKSEYSPNANLSARADKKMHSNFSEISHDYLCMYQAKSLSVNELPAIVFDQQYVVYGTADLAEAKNQFKRYIRRHG